VTRRYYCPELTAGGPLFSLDEAEAGHAIKVMRVQVGDEVELFDGKGSQAKASIASVSRKECHLKIESVAQIDREPSVKLQFAIAMPKPDRCKEMIERLTELGVCRVVPIIAARTQREPSPSLIGKLRRAVIESCKQSQRNVLMEVADPMRLQAFLSKADDVTDTNTDDLAAKWVAHPDGEAITSASIQAVDAATLLVGPEGGWTQAEIDEAVSAEYQKISLGKRIYRIETAAVYLASKLIHN
jgi:16S rRNA (uracil1498-N3)-methyltransferase